MASYFQASCFEGVETSKEELPSDLYLPEPSWWRLDPSSDVEIHFRDRNEDKFGNLEIGLHNPVKALVADPYIRIRNNKEGPLRRPGPWHEINLSQDENFVYSIFTKEEDGQISVEIFCKGAPPLGKWTPSERNL